MSFNIKKEGKAERVRDVLAVSKKRRTLAPEELAKKLTQLALDHKAEDLVILDVGKFSSYADFLVIASARSARHVQGVAEAVEEALYAEGIEPLGVEGKTEGQWVLMDYGDVVLHIFFEPVREVYDLEGLWLEAPRLSPEDWGLTPGPSTEEEDEGS